MHQVPASLPLQMCSHFSLPLVLPLSDGCFALGLVLWGVDGPLVGHSWKGCGPGQGRLSATWVIVVVGLNILSRTPCHQVPVSSPPGSGDRVAFWHGGGPEAASDQRGLQEADHSGPSPRSAVRRHGQHPGRAVGQSHGAGPGRDARPAAGNSPGSSFHRSLGKSPEQLGRSRDGLCDPSLFLEGMSAATAKWPEIPFPSRGDPG